MNFASGFSLTPTHVGPMVHSPASVTITSILVLNIHSHVTALLLCGDQAHMFWFLFTVLEHQQGNFKLRIEGSKNIC